MKVNRDSAGAEKLNIEERVAALESCGDAESVAGLLRRSGIKGWRNSCGDCPVAAYILDAPDCKGVTVGQVNSDIIFEDREDEMEWTHSLAVRTFIGRFDDGSMYGDLDAGAAP